VLRAYSVSGEEQAPPGWMGWHTAGSPAHTQLKAEATPAASCPLQAGGPTPVVGLVIGPREEVIGGAG